MYRRVYQWILMMTGALCLLCCTFAKLQGQSKSAIDSLQAALARAGAEDTARVKILIGFADAYRPGLVTKEFYYANEALNLAEKLDWETGKMYAEQYLGDCYYRVTAFNDAIAHFKRAIALAEKLKRPDIETFCLKYIVTACYKANRPGDMVAYQKLSVDLAHRVGEPVQECRQMNIYALRLSDAGYYRQALDYWQKNIAFANARFSGLQRDEQLAVILNTMANTYVKMQAPDSALYYLRIATKLNAPTNDSYNRAYIVSTICDVYESTRRYDSAEIYGERTVKMGEALNNLDLQRHYCGTLSRVYEADHKPALALVYYKKYDSLDNLISDGQEIVDQALQVTKINLQQATERNTLERRASDIIRHNQRTALIAVVVALMALVALMAFTYRNLRQKQKANKTIGQQAESLRQQNEIIDRALKEKEMLLKETHHRVKNNLQLISSLLELQAAGLQDENAKNALRKAQDRVLSIATVHSKLYGNSEDESIAFPAFVDELFGRLSNAFAPEQKALQFENTVPPTMLPLATVVLLGLILNELITNSFKHAFKETPAPAIRIGLEHSENNYRLSYYDNGAGLPAGALEQESGSLGLYIVKRLSKQLKGSVAYRYEAGSIFTIIFPDAGN